MIDFTAQITKIKHLQLQSAQNRKELATNTKNFKKLDSQELKLKEVKTLLKQYQGEIDSLTERCQVSEDFILKASETFSDKYSEEERVAKEKEAQERDDLINNELELKRERISQLLARNEELINELKKSKIKGKENEERSVDASKLSELEFGNIQLINKLDQIENINKGNNKKIEQLTNKIDSLQKDNSNLMDKLKQMRDYDDLKHELNTLRLISFGDEKDSDDEESHGQLDEILISRNKKLNDDLIKYRSEKETFESKIASLQSQLKESTASIEQLTKTNNLLESELNRFDQTISSGKFDTASMVSTFTAKKTNGSIIGGVIPEEEHSSVLPIITSQRDRFRSKTIELETQLKKQTITINELKLEISKMKKTNSELFERTRYLASFQKGTVNRFDNSDYENQDNYEESLHPLAKFREIEQQRIASKLSPLERIFLSFAKAILANKTSRMLFLIYCFGLHCLIMLMSIYVMGLHGSLTPEVGKLDKTVIS